MKTRFIIALAIALIPYITYGQKKGKKNESEDMPVKMEKSVDITFDSLKFHRSFANRDYSVALDAVYNILIKQPENTAWLDSMAVIYYYTGDYAKTVRLVDSILTIEPEKPTILEMKAISLKNLGYIAEALDIYEDIYKKDPNVIYKYQIAELQYHLKRYGEVETSVNEIISTPETENVQIRISVTPRQFQMVPVKAAAYNVLGMAMLDFKNKEKAKSAFSKALEIYPEFFLAKQNLASMEEKKDDQKQ